MRAATGGDTLIETVWGKGYRFSEERDKPNE